MTPGREQTSGVSKSSTSTHKLAEPFKERCGASFDPVTDPLNPYGFTPQFDLIHDPTCVFSVLISQKLEEAVDLMGHGYAVFGKIIYWTEGS